MHSIDYLLREVEEKLNMVNSMKMKYQKSNMASRQNLDSLKAAIDKSISYHIETLKIRGDWLKSHADHIFNLKKESLSSKLENLDSFALQLQSCLDESSDVDTEQEIRQKLTSALRQVDISEIPLAGTGLFMFTADDKTLNENIISFGSITNLQDEQDSDSGFVFADMTEEIDVISNGDSGTYFPAIESNRSSIPETSNDGLCSAWLLSGKHANGKIPFDQKSTQCENASNLSDWLMTNSSTERTEEECVKVEHPPSQWLVGKNRLIHPSSEDEDTMSVISTSTFALEDYSRFLYKDPKNKIDTSFLLQRNNSASNQTTTFSSSMADADLQSYIRPTRSSQEKYEYPKRAFLEHCDYLQRQDASKYLVERPSKDAASKLPFEDEKCQWLFKKGECSGSNTECSKGSCEMFDKKWLKTITDW